MNGTLSHRTQSGLFISLPMPQHAVAYAIQESAEEILVVWAMKPPGGDSVANVMAKAKEQFPGVKWQYTANIYSMGYLTGSPHEYTSYRLIKRSDGAYVLDAANGGTMGEAMSNVLSPVAHSAPPISRSDLDSLLRSLNIRLDKPGDRTVAVESSDDESPFSAPD